MTSFSSTSFSTTGGTGDGIAPVFSAGTPPSTVLRDTAVAVCQSSSVAAAAGVSYSSWSSTSAPHVFGGFGGFIGGRNRGRLPFVEISVVSQSFDELTADGGGDLEQRLVVRCHVGGTSPADAEDTSGKILTACLISIRNTLTEIADVGGDQIGDLQQSPLGHVREATLTVLQNFHRDTYEATE